MLRSHPISRLHLLGFAFEATPSACTRCRRCYGAEPHRQYLFGKTYELRQPLHVRLLLRIEIIANGRIANRHGILELLRAGRSHASKAPIVDLVGTQHRTFVGRTINQVFTAFVVLSSDFERCEI